MLAVASSPPSAGRAQAWVERGLPGHLLPVDGANHFTILDSLAAIGRGVISACHVAGSVTVVAQDAYFNTTTAYTGTVAVTSSETGEGIAELRGSIAACR